MFADLRSLPQEVASYFLGSCSEGEIIIQYEYYPLYYCFINYTTYLRYFKKSSDGKLLHEMILVCDAYRKDLQHPNEFVRGSTLRYNCTLGLFLYFTLLLFFSGGLLGTCEATLVPFTNFWFTNLKIGTSDSAY